jgi:enoyl-CoA hydratase
MMSPNSYQSLTLKIDSGVAQLRLVKPDKLNQFDEGLHREFADAVLELSARSDVKVMITSAEGKAFSAGGDMNMMLKANQSKAMRDRLSYEAKVIFDVYSALPFPTIVALQGAAIGLGATIVTLSDIIVAWRGAKLADPHVQLGLVAGDGGVVSWAQSIGLNRAKRYLFTGERITAERAYEMGLVTDLVDVPEETLPAAEKIAATIAAYPRGGIEGTKRAFSKLSQQIAGPVFELSLAYEMETLASAELRDTVTKMLQK